MSWMSLESFFSPSVRVNRLIEKQSLMAFLVLLKYQRAGYKRFVCMYGELPGKYMLFGSLFPHFKHSGLLLAGHV